MKRSIQPKYIVLIFVPGFVVLLDQFTKHLVLENFRLGEVKTIVPDLFNLTFIRNPGAAFGFLSSLPASLRIPFFIIVPFVALLAIGYVFHQLPRSDRKRSLALSLITGGAIGNLIDRIQLRWVVDWLDFHFRSQYHYPAFNFADVAICVGVGVLILNHTRESSSSGKRMSSVPVTGGRDGT